MKNNNYFGMQKTLYDRFGSLADIKQILFEFSNLVCSKFLYRMSALEQKDTSNLRTTDNRTVGLK